MAKNKFEATKPGFTTLIDCKCNSINAFNKGENKVFDDKRVGDNCDCQIVKKGEDRKKAKVEKVFRVFVGERS